MFSSYFNFVVLFLAGYFSFGSTHIIKTPNNILRPLSPWKLYEKFDSLSDGYSLDIKGNEVNVEEYCKGNSCVRKCCPYGNYLYITMDEETFSLSYTCKALLTRGAVKMMDLSQENGNTQYLLFDGRKFPECGMADLDFGTTNITEEGLLQATSYDSSNVDFFSGEEFCTENGEFYHVDGNLNIYVILYILHPELNKALEEVTDNAISDSDDTNTEDESTEISTEDESTETSTEDESTETSTEDESTETITEDESTETSTEDETTETSTFQTDGVTETSTEDKSTETSTFQTDEVTETLDMETETTVTNV